MTETGDAGSGRRTPREGEVPRAGTRHRDTGEHAEFDAKVRRNRVPEAEGSAKDPD